MRESCLGEVSGIASGTVWRRQWDVSAEKPNLLYFVT